MAEKKAGKRSVSAGCCSRFKVIVSLPGSAHSPPRANFHAVFLLIPLIVRLKCSLATRCSSPLTGTTDPSAGSVENADDSRADACSAVLLPHGLMAERALPAGALFPSFIAVLFKITNEGQNLFCHSCCGGKKIGLIRPFCFLS